MDGREIERPSHTVSRKLIEFEIIGLKEGIELLRSVDRIGPNELEERTVEMRKMKKLINTYAPFH